MLAFNESPEVRHHSHELRPRGVSYEQAQKVGSAIAESTSLSQLSLASSGVDAAGMAALMSGLRNSHGVALCLEF